MDHGNQLATIVRDLEFSEIWPFWRPGLNPILWMLSLSRGGGARRLSERWWAKAVRITHFLVPLDTNSVDPKPKNHQCRAQIVTLNPSAQSSPWINGTSSLKAWNASSLLADVAAVWAYVGSCFLYHQSWHCGFGWLGCLEAGHVWGYSIQKTICNRAWWQEQHWNLTKKAMSLN